MLTTSQIKSFFLNKIDKSYTGYFDDARLNRIFKSALLQSVEQKYRTLDQEKIYDELRFLIKTEESFKVNNNKLYLQPLAISSISLGGGGATFTTELPHNLIANDTVVISDVTGITGSINGSFTVDTIASDYSFFITIGGLGGSYTSISGLASIPIKGIMDYMHSLTIRANFNQTIKEAGSVASVYIGSDYVKITFKQTHNIRPQELITISGVSGTGTVTDLNDDWNISRYDDYSIWISTSVTGTVSSVKNIAVSQYFYEYCKYNYSDRKIGVFGIPKVSEPSYEDGNDLIKIYPLDEICDEITIDYLARPQVYIDFSDTTLTNFDWGTRYPEKFLYYVIDYAANIVYSFIRDTEGIQIESKTILENP